MAEYIEREAVIDLITRRYENPEICTQEINSIPDADVAPVVHGRWIYDEKAQRPYCSVCKRHFYGATNSPMNYCPNCGGKMDGGADHEAD